MLLLKKKLTVGGEKRLYIPTETLNCLPGYNGENFNGKYSVAFHVWYEGRPRLICYSIRRGRYKKAVFSKHTWGSLCQEKGFVAGDTVKILRNLDGSDAFRYELLVLKRLQPSIDSKALDLELKLAPPEH
ncbi:hypothetical protein SLEP1_g28886 [Rubroshorea leprosula]|uniref:TF-B3 domain-containing protein n=1 Tax=Rubroshorea leprosula TaxID=152421 RepID=A0AAV5K727_9ROSI|nr:hypothetical protein SLEP1_g28886 [Rubroshorea leprosula]